jgi:MYXO-CTERM domain-containing protein
MYVTTAPCDVHKRVLTSDDTTTLGALYAPPTVVVAHCATSPGARGESTLGMVMAALALVLRRRRRSMT